MDDSEFLDGNETQQYQSLIGAMQWAVSIGRFDITTAIMTLSGLPCPDVGTWNVLNGSMATLHGWNMR